jgi:hypothetical protein
VVPTASVESILSCTARRRVGTLIRNTDVTLRSAFFHFTLEDARPAESTDAYRFLRSRPTSMSPQAAFCASSYTFSVFVGFLTRLDGSSG